MGESLIDFVTLPSGAPSKILMEGNPGGAPLNVLSAAAKLDRETAYITKVGKDVFGALIKKQIEGLSISLDGLIEGDELTTLAIVTLDEAGDRSFAFYRNQTADVSLAEAEVDFELIKTARIFHFGSVSMTHQPARDATIASARFAQEQGIKVSFDPNYRAFLWKNEEEAIKAIRLGMGLADYAKVSEEEAFLLTGTKDPEASAGMLADEYALDFVAVTLGSNGAGAIANGVYRFLPTYDVKVIDTTGAGDAFWGASLHKLLGYEEKGLALNGEALEELLDYANAAGAITTTGLGAQAPLPTDGDIRALIETQARLG
ncbi:MAG: carbohydrate kinase [Syntrophorhabdaceae bacterium]|nr:carbohydrate kinase [Syntrophorhabdaceae bacterium]